MGERRRRERKFRKNQGWKWTFLAGSQPGYQVVKSSSPTRNPVASGYRATFNFHPCILTMALSRNRSIFGPAIALNLDLFSYLPVPKVPFYEPLTSTPSPNHLKHLLTMALSRNRSIFGPAIALNLDLYSFRTCQPLKYFSITCCASTHRLWYTMAAYKRRAYGK